MTRRLLEIHCLVGWTMATILSSGLVAAQTGTPGQITKWQANGITLADSVISESADGNIGIGTSNPQNLLHVGPGTSSILASRVTAVVASDSGESGIAIAQNSGVNLMLQASGAGGYMGTTSNHPLVWRTNDQDRMAIDQNGNVAIGTGNPQNLLHVGPGTSSILASRVTAVVASNSGESGIAIAQNSGVNLMLQASGAGGYMGTTSNHPLVWRTNDQDRMAIDQNGNVVITTGNVGVGTTNPTAKLQVAGMTKTNVLQITGGADLSERFDVAHTQSKIEPGMVVAIDPKNPGKLAVSAQAYNQRVAGVISGAGGVQPGMLMGQSGTLADGDQPVALSGRVYVWADASNAPIAPGDLLTTSNLAGHAMKVRDHRKAQGAILGKAMTELRQGRGLVLTLVTLQ
jgi:hypothetical protein